MSSATAIGEPTLIANTNGTIAISLLMAFLLPVFSAATNSALHGKWRQGSRWRAAKQLRPLFRARFAQEALKKEEEEEEERSPPRLELSSHAGGGGEARSEPRLGTAAAEA